MRIRLAVLYLQGNNNPNERHIMSGDGLYTKPYIESDVEQNERYDTLEEFWIDND